MSNRRELGDFVYDLNERTLRLPYGLGVAPIDFGFCSGTNLRYVFPRGAEAKSTDKGVVLSTDAFSVPRRLGHGGVVCWHRPAYPEGLTISGVEGTAELKRNEHGFDVVMSGRAAEGLKSAFVHMRHFPAHAEILVPCQGGYSLKEIPPETIHVFEYPGPYDWVHQFVIFQCDNAGMMIRFDDPTYALKRLVISTLEPEHGLQVSLYAEPAERGAPEEWTSPPFKFESFRGGWEVAAGRYRNWLEAKRSLKPFRTAEVVPERQRDISLVLLLRAANWPPFIYNTFDQLCDRLKEVAQHIEPRYCLAYIEGFDGGYTAAGSEFWPGANVGGPEGFKRLVDCAHELGYLIAPHLHTHCLMIFDPLWERFKNATFSQWVTDSDGDGVPELQLKNVRTDNAEWNEMVLPRLERLFNSFDLDGALLDQIAVFVPRERPSSYIASCREFIGKVSAMMRPGTFLMTEGLAETYLDIVRMGMTPVHSGSYPPTNSRTKDMPRMDHMRFHPVLKYVMNHFARPIGHCSVRAAEETTIHAYQARNYAQLGVTPLLALHRPGARIADSPLLVADIARAKRIAEGSESAEYPE